MTPTRRVALSSGAGALVGALAGGLLSLAGAAVAGAGPSTKSREMAVVFGVAVGAALGSASLGAYVEHKELAAGQPA